MATTTFFTVMYASDDATFRLWGKGLSDALAAAGLTKLSAGESSGQIDWTSVARPAINTMAGYEMWRFSDTLQATAPVFLKVEYGIAGTAGYISVQLTVAFAHNGAGTLTGFTSTPTTIYVAANGGATIYAHKASGSTNRIVVFEGFQGGSTFTFGFGVERTHDASGNDTPEGVFVVTWRSTTPNLMLVTYATGLLTTEATASALLPSVGSGSIGTITSFYPIFMARGPFLSPSLNFGYMFTGNLTVGLRVNVSLLGATRVFFPCSSTWTTRGNVSGTTLMIRDE